MLTSTHVTEEFFGQSRPDEYIERSRLPNAQNLFCFCPLPCEQTHYSNTFLPLNFLWQLLKGKSPVSVSCKCYTFQRKQERKSRRPSYIVTIKTPFVGLFINYLFHAEGNRTSTREDTRSQACLTSAWSTDSLPSLCTGWSKGSVCFFFISYCTLKLLNAYEAKQFKMKNMS